MVSDIHDTISRKGILTQECAEDRSNDSPKHQIVWEGNASMRSRWLKVMTPLLSLLVVALVSSVSLAQPWTVGISNGFVGSEWRTQMIENFLKAAEEYQARGLIDRVIVQSADVDVNGQIQQIRNMIAAGVDAIIINPNSQTALDAVIEEAAMRGVIVIAVDQAVTAPDALNVVIDQSEWARISARWLAEQLGGKGNIVVINGIAGHPANEDRWDGASEVFASYPGINVLTVTHANWDQATGQQVMANLLATYPNIDGVWVQDGMAEGALRALLASGRPLPVMTGEARIGYMRLWNELRTSRGFNTIGVVNPPGIAVTGLHVAMQLLQGRELRPEVLRGNTLFVPIPYAVTADNFEEIWNAYKDYPDSYSLDGWLTEEEVRAYFQ